jgi:hypothetical protein
MWWQAVGGCCGGEVFFNVWRFSALKPHDKEMSFLFLSLCI